MPTGTDRLLAEFAVWLAREGRSPLTVRAYVAELERLAAWASPAFLTKLTPAQVVQYLDLVAGDDSPATRNLRIAAIRKFFAWALAAGLVRNNPAAELHGPRVEHTVVSFLPREAVRALLEILTGNLRDRAIFLVVLSTGVKLMELIHFDRPDFRVAEESAELAVRASEEETRTVYPSEQATEAVATYLDSRRDEAPPLFVSRGGERIAPRTVQSAFTVHFRRAGVPGSLRTLRHTFGMHRAQSGMAAQDLQELMGYRTLESTRIYQDPDPGRLRDVSRRTEERY